MLQIKNFAKSTLAAGISSTDTSLTVATGEGAKFPDPPFRIIIDNEIIEVGAKSGDTFSSLIRGVEGTTAAAHAAGASVELRIFASILQELEYIPINTQTTNYTLVFADAGKLINMNSSSAVTLTVPANSSVPFPIGTRIYVRKGGAGNVTISGASGVTINAPFGNTITTQYQTVVLIKVDTNTWDLLA
jgi:hypothetical protein